MQAQGFKPAGCIVGEPTGMQVVIAHKGKHSYKTTVHGFEAHSSLTPLGVNAVEIACEFVANLKSMHRELVQNGPFDPIYDVPHTTVHTGVIAGGTALNIIPRQCEVTWEIRHHHLNTPEDLFARAKAFGESLVPAMQAVAPGTGITHELKSVLPGFATAADSEIANLCFDCAEVDPASGAGKPVCPPSCAALATSRRRTSPTNGSRWTSWLGASASCAAWPTGCVWPDFFQTVEPQQLNPTQGNSDDSTS
jgi:acetylornithine deacetylase